MHSHTLMNNISILEFVLYLKLERNNTSFSQNIPHVRVFIYKFYCISEMVLTGEVRGQVSFL